jgi:hypothetical protein
MDRDNDKDANEATPDEASRAGDSPADPKDDDAIAPNPPRTTKWGITAPKFGSSGSGGAELEPGPERD